MKTPLMKAATKKAVLAPLMTATLLLGVSSTYAATATYDWSTATASAGAGTTLNTANGNISGANDGWHGSSTTDEVFAVNDNQPTGFSGNYVTLGSEPSNINGWRDNDGNFGYSIASDDTEVTLSLVLNISSATGLAWMGLSDNASQGGEHDFRIGFFNGNWTYRDNDSTIVSMADTGVSAVGAVAKSYRVTATFDLVGNTYDYTVENLSDGGSVLLADDVAVDSSVANLDWSVYDGLRIRGDEASIDTFTVSSGQEPSEAFAITEVRRDGDMITIKWESEEGMLYRFHSETDLSAPDPLSWPLFAGLEGIEATPPINTKTFMAPAESEHFFVIEQYPAPPIVVFAEDFESGAAGWATGFNPADPGMNTIWQLGAPAAPGPAAASGGANCYGTNLAADYGVSSNIWLRTPPGEIDLTEVTSATLVFQQWVDMDDFDLGDTGTVRVLDANDLTTVLETLQADIQGLNPGEWVEFSANLTEDSLGNSVVLEFLFVSDDVDEGDASGWYIDGVEVTQP